MAKSKIPAVGDQLPDLKDLDKKAVKEWLQSKCYNLEEGDYIRDLEDPELEQLQRDLTKYSIKISKLEAAKKRTAAEFKARLQHPKDRRNEIVNALENKNISVSGLLYLIQLEDHGLMLIVDKDGIIRDRRPLTAEERQTKIMELPKESAQSS